MLKAQACASSRLVGFSSGSRLAVGPYRAQLRTCRQHPVQRQASGEEPSTSKPTTPAAQEDDPIWVKREKQRAFEAQSGKKGLPWPVYLLSSAIVAIAAVGSIFEFADKNPIFGVVQPDSPLWAPILGFFALTGLPLSGFLFFKCVQAANEAAEAQDRMDGYIK